MNRRPVAGSQPKPNATTTENATDRRLEVQTQGPPSLLEEAQKLLADVSGTSVLLDLFRARGWDENTRIVEELSETAPSGLPDEELRSLQDLLPRKIEYLKFYSHSAKTTRENIGNLLKDLNGLVNEVRYFATVVSTQGQEIDSRKRKAIELSATVEKQIAEASRAKKVKMEESDDNIRDSTRVVDQNLAMQRMREASEIRFRDVEILQNHFEGHDPDSRVLHVDG
ncbi:hypothetical protein QBC37DRAFT_463388 [Rhypophila decipiens]|uniref:Uncharacterized protein n=1 Tax=Rhypophila decipiens TaxID=261697 RepID=A0AAN7BAU5_9PEZI|nr:hypothetical protein QBC37DRAFT_463388 [Rhypophila decipiens]